MLLVLDFRVTCRKLLIIALFVWKHTWPSSIFLCCPMCYYVCIECLSTLQHPNDHDTSQHVQLKWMIINMWAYLPNPNLYSSSCPCLTAHIISSVQDVWWTIQVSNAICRAPATSQSALQGTHKVPECLRESSECLRENSAAVSTTQCTSKKHALKSISII